MVAMVSIVSALAAFFCFSAVFSKVGGAADLREHRLAAVAKNYVHTVVDVELEKSFYQRFLKPIIFSVINTVRSGLSKRPAKGKNAAKSMKTEKALKAAGIMLTADEYTAICAIGALILTVLAGSLAFIVGADRKICFLVALFSAAVAVIAPSYILKFIITSRQRAIRNQLPGAIDILSVSIEAGLGFDAALIKVSKGLKGALPDELEIVYREIQMGRPRRDALKGLSERTNVAELKSFTSAVISSDQLGIPLKNVLRSQSAQLRAARKQHAEEKGMKAPIKMMLPMVVFIFPVIIIILIGPTIIRVMNGF